MHADNDAIQIFLDGAKLKTGFPFDEEMMDQHVPRMRTYNGRKSVEESTGGNTCRNGLERRLSRKSHNSDLAIPPLNFHSLITPFFTAFTSRLGLSGRHTFGGTAVSQEILAEHFIRAGRNPELRMSEVNAGNPSTPNSHLGI
ncbi:hypothetical protein M407DRAFT_11724 [Tulasnella calospora MUT 4182]|uniref:Uncharacterized protein n=1 Tax=Tulasnella calospora MUT 4182 TaxID=1051891 RepID=A0A0C3KBA5_9AGAM|nr:hypothetical protein M407DRAFT_11724 [Tulasnella calospora MUT 4182]